MQEQMACVRKMVDYIEARIGDTPSLYDIAREVGYSPYHCSTMFHRVSGMGQLNRQAELFLRWWNRRPWALNGMRRNASAISGTTLRCWDISCYDR